MGLLSRIWEGAVGKAVPEGASTPGPWMLPITGGMLDATAGSYLNWWQLGHRVESGEVRSAIVQACVTAYAQTVAMCPGGHWRASPEGGRHRVDNSALARILAAPNAYESISDLLLNLTADLYTDGNAYALALRNSRFEVDELHLFPARKCKPCIAVDGSVFYDLDGNEIVERMVQGPLRVPARDVLHVRLLTPRHRLVGESPIRAAAMDVATADAITGQQLAFYLNQGRPSTVLSTELPLTQEQAKQVRDAWNEQSKGLRAGGVPILSNGLKPFPLAQPTANQQIADILRLSAQNIALAYRVPLQMLGTTNGNAPVASTESLMQLWIASGLGFALNHIEEAFGRLFGLRGLPHEYLEFDTGALLRSSMGERVAALAQGVQGGIYAPNEARALEGLKPVPFGDEPRVQQQVVPLSAAAAIPAAPAAPAAPPAPATPAETPDAGTIDDAQRAALVAEIAALTDRLAAFDKRGRAVELVIRGHAARTPAEFRAEVELTREHASRATAAATAARAIDAGTLAGRGTAAFAETMPAAALVMTRHVPAPASDAGAALERRLEEMEEPTGAAAPEETGSEHATVPPSDPAQSEPATPPAPDALPGQA